MYSAYSDIRSRIDEEPTWYDYNGVPRYGEIPEDCREWAARIRCQYCGSEFTVLMVDEVYHAYGGHLIDIRIGEPCPVEPNERHLEFRAGGLSHHDRPNDPLPDGWHYGDPPIHGCVGDTMNSIPEYEWDDYFDEDGEPKQSDA